MASASMATASRVRLREDGSKIRPAWMRPCAHHSAASGRKSLTLFVTTARYNMTPDELAQDPNAGALFSIELDDGSIQGLPADLFAI